MSTGRERSYILSEFGDEEASCGAGRRKQNLGVSANYILPPLCKGRLTGEEDARESFFLLRKVILRCIFHLTK